MTTHPTPIVLTLVAHLAAREDGTGEDFEFGAGDRLEVIARGGPGLRTIVRYVGDRPDYPAHLRGAIGPCRVDPLALALATSV